MSHDNFTQNQSGSWSKTVATMKMIAQTTNLKNPKPTLKINLIISPTTRMLLNFSIVITLLVHIYKSPILSTKVAGTVSFFYFML